MYLQPDRTRQLMRQPHYIENSHLVCESRETGNSPSRLIRCYPRSEKSHDFKPSSQDVPDDDMTTSHLASSSTFSFVIPPSNPITSCIASIPSFGPSYGAREGPSSAKVRYRSISIWLVPDEPSGPSNL